MVTPAVLASLIISRTIDLETTSRLAVGSSRSRKRGAAIKALARFKRCCSPPLKVMGLACQRLSSIPRRLNQRVASLRASSRGMPHLTSGSAVTSMAGTRGNTLRNCEQKPSSRSRNFTTTSSLSYLPLGVFVNECEVVKQLTPTTCTLHKLLVSVLRWCNLLHQFVKWIILHLTHPYQAPLRWIILEAACAGAAQE